jgi:pimeloyl-ACP methyl ester carboxylesterase
MDVPALVIAHQSDRIHPFHDAEQLVRRMPNARLIKASSVMELRVRPERLTSEINAFLKSVWAPKRTGRKAV